MENKKDELITGAELARRLKVSAPYIAKKKDVLKSCKYGKKYYFIKSSLALGRNPDNPHQSYQQVNNKKDDIKVEPQKEVNSDNVVLSEMQQLKKENEQLKNRIKELENQSVNNNDGLTDIQNSIKNLYKEMSLAISDKSTTKDYAVLNGLKSKAQAVKELELAVKEGIKNKQLLDNLYEKDEVLKVISYFINTFRNALINIPNNYAVNLDGMDKKQMKDFITEDINKILEDFMNIGAKFE